MDWDMEISVSKNPVTLPIPLFEGIPNRFWSFHLENTRLEIHIQLRSKMGLHLLLGFGTRNNWL